ncbi:MAG: hypothetical protein HXX16_15265 [Bacteroidales bacterium]|nr:hypothetical protein [Bacteroidales bacterium]
MHKTIIYHIGGIHHKLIEINNYFHVIDQPFFHSETSKNVFVADFFKNDSIMAISPLAEDFSNLVIYSYLDVKYDETIQVQITRVFNTFFASIKNSYQLLMQQKNLRIWVLEPDINLQDGRFITEVNSFKAGVKALTTVVAMELAKKKVNVNYLENSFQLQYFHKLLEWSENQQNLYLTAQNLNFNAKP